MRKAAMLVGMVAFLSVMFASVALAVDKQCLHRPCQGTDNNDRLFERRGEGVGDTIYGRAGRDFVRADAYAQDTDLLYGNRGNDRLNANDNGFSETTPEDTLDTVHGAWLRHLHRRLSRGDRRRMRGGAGGPGGSLRGLCPEPEVGPIRHCGPHPQRLLPSTRPKSWRLSHPP
jgi:hypothetical protein